MQTKLAQRLSALESVPRTDKAQFAHDVASDVVRIYYRELTGNEAQAKIDELAAEIHAKGISQWIADGYAAAEQSEKL